MSTNETVKQEELGKVILAALGIDATDVCRVAIVCEPNRPTLVTVSRRYMPKALSGEIAESLESYVALKATYQEAD